MATTASSSQPNGVPPASSAGPSQSQSQPTQSSTTVTASQATASGSAPAPAAAAATAPNGPASPSSTSAPRPRDARTIELLLTSQGVTSYDQRVPLLLLDFAYRHTSSILSDALHLASDPYTTQAGAKPSGASGAVPSAPANADARSAQTPSTSPSPAGRPFRSGEARARVAGGGGASKDWLLELAKERNKVQLPRVMAHEWGVRLPNERFVLSGMPWGLRDTWAEGTDDDDDEDDEEGQMEDAMEGVEVVKKEPDTKDGAEPGGLDELLGDDLEEGDEDMEGME
ncbi:hypothetical protein G7054_g3952 [Neopestalotiopsis clavispora]|nr:hypothetical protein G7054_g3952 [Neopestalotiopsis clavispora]